MIEELKFLGKFTTGWFEQRIEVFVKIGGGGGWVRLGGGGGGSGWM